MINVNYVFLPFTCRKELAYSLSGGVGLCSKGVQIILPAFVLGNSAEYSLLERKAVC